MTDVSTRPVTSPADLDEGDHERFAHIVDERYGTVAEAIVNGTTCRALCGKVWRPSRDPKRFPLCPTCREVAEARGWRVPAH
jgi:hypothetical protein